MSTKLLLEVQCLDIVLTIVNLLILGQATVIGLGRTLERVAIRCIGAMTQVNVVRRVETQPVGNGHVGCVSHVQRVTDVVLAVVAVRTQRVTG